MSAAVFTEVIRCHTLNVKQIVANDHDVAEAECLAENIYRLCIQK